MHRFVYSALAYLPVQLISSLPKAKEITDGAAARIEEEKQRGILPPGLADQYDIQLRALKDGTLPDIQIIASPAPYSTRCECVVLLIQLSCSDTLPKLRQKKENHTYAQL